MCVIKTRSRAEQQTCQSKMSIYYCYTYDDTHNYQWLPLTLKNQNFQGLGVPFFIIPQEVAHQGTQ